MPVLLQSEWPDLPVNHTDVRSSRLVRKERYQEPCWSRRRSGLLQRGLGQVGRYLCFSVGELVRLCFVAEKTHSVSI